MPVATIDLNQASRWHSRGARDALAVLATPRRIRFDELLGLVQREVAPDELGLTPDSLEPMLVLSYTLLNFPAEVADSTHGTTLLEYVLYHFGTKPIERLPPLKCLRVSGAGLNAYWARGDLARYRDLVESLAKDGLDTDNTSRGLNIRHPALRPDGAEVWLERFNATFFPAAGWELDFRDRGAPRLDEIIMGTLPEDLDETLVSVILTCFNTGPPLITAVRSVLGQTHRNLELVVVDDGSSDQSHLDEVEGLDPRVRVVRLPENLGTYNARNVGIDATSGALITFQDSDDWSHPMRLETQVRVLRENPKLLQVLGYSVFAGDELYLRDPFEPIAIAGSTAMFRREQVAEVGYYDRVRRSADSEHIVRLETAGPDTSVHLNDVP
ncbi:MAG: glycosyltransferase, partial [Aeromicrobium sp.]|nr:glycosyltransferase [Aeromicrobium sp.]